MQALKTYEAKQMAQLKTEERSNKPGVQKASLEANRTVHKRKSERGDSKLAAKKEKREEAVANAEAAAADADGNNNNTNC